MSKKLSVIIPVYRVEATLNRCLQSVVDQLPTNAGTQEFNMEIILVDDGSPDRCPELCDEWARKDSRIKVVHQSNGGLSNARNTGINLACGDCITFVDSDDYLAPNTYQPLMKLLAEHPEYDIVEYPAREFEGSSRERMLSFPNETVYSDMQQYWYEGEAYRHCYACNKIYRRMLFQDVRFPDGEVFEDVATLVQLLPKTQCVATSNQGCYHYTANPEGITAKADGNALSMLLKSHVGVVNKSERKDAFFQHYYLHVLNIQMDVYELYGEPLTLQQRQVDPSLFTGIEKLKATIFNILGISGICKLNKLIHKIWRRRP